MILSPELATSAQQIFKDASRIICTTHKNPDGDAVGSLLGMALLLEAQYPEKQIIRLCLDPAPETMHFLPGVHQIVNQVDVYQGDAAIILDCGIAKQTGLEESHPHLFDGSIPTINMDHHQGNPNFSQINIVQDQAASTCEIVAALAQSLSLELNSDIATCLLTGVYTDTGGLVHSNTNADVYRTVARLLRAGARQPEMVKQVFRTSKPSTLKLWGRVLEKISITPEGGAISAVTEGDFRATGAHHSELTGAIDYLNAVPGMRFSLILSERDGLVKGSIRTLRDDVDVAEMASKFSGGGHKKAAGFAVEGKLEPEVRWRVVDN